MEMYVYRHRRLDTNEIFYVGIGKGKRAFDKKSRNRFWKFVTNKTYYQIEIIAENLSLEDAKELEIFLISLYGRKNLGVGTLVNLTDGGEGSTGVLVSKETRLKRTSFNNHFYNKKHSEKTKQLMRQNHANVSGQNNPMFNRSGINSPKSSIILNLENGIFHHGLKEASSTYDIKYENLKAYLNGKAKNKTKLIKT